MEKTCSYTIKDLENILGDVKMCMALYCTKNGETNSSFAENYLNWLNQYTRYCIPERIHEWRKCTKEILYSPLVLKYHLEETPKIKAKIKARDYFIIDTLYNFMNAGEIMEAYNETHSWESIDEILEQQGHTGYTFSGLTNVMIHFSLLGPEFIERYDPNRLNRDEDFKKEYEEAKAYLKERKNLERRLIYALKHRDVNN